MQTTQLKFPSFLCVLVLCLVSTWQALAASAVPQRYRIIYPLKVQNSDTQVESILEIGDVIEQVTGDEKVPAWAHGFKLVKSATELEPNAVYLATRHLFDVSVEYVDSYVSLPSDDSEDGNPPDMVDSYKQRNSCYEKKVVSWTGTYYRKVESAVSKNYVGILVRARLPQVFIDPARNYVNPAVKGTPAAIDHWQTGTMDRPAVYLGGNLGDHELDLGLTWRKMCDPKGRPVYTDLPSGTDGRQAKHRFVESKNAQGLPVIINGFGTVVAEGRTDVDQMKMKLIANYAFRPFIRTTSFGKGWYPWEKPVAGEGQCTDEVTGVPQYYYPGDRVRMDLHMVAENRMVLTVDLLGPVGKNNESVGPTTFSQEFEHTGANNWSGKTFKRVHTIDQYRKDGSNQRVNNAKPDWVVPTKTKLWQGQWEKVLVLVRENTMGLALNCQNGTEIWGTDINQLHNKKPIFVIKNQTDIGGEDFGIFPHASEN